MSTTDNELSSAFDEAKAIISMMQEKHREGIPMVPVFPGIPVEELSFSPLPPDGARYVPTTMFVFSTEPHLVDAKEVSVFVTQGDKTVCLNVIFTTTEGFSAPDFDRPEFKGKTIALFDAPGRHIGLHVAQSLLSLGRDVLNQSQEPGLEFQKPSDFDLLRSHVDDVEFGKNSLDIHFRRKNSSDIRGLPKGKKALRNLKNIGRGKHR